MNNINIYGLIEELKPCDSCSGLNCFDNTCKDLDNWWKLKDEIHSLEEKVNKLELALERKEKEYMILEDDYNKNLNSMKVLYGWWANLVKSHKKYTKALDKYLEECAPDGCVGCPCHCNWVLDWNGKECLERRKKWCLDETN